MFGLRRLKLQRDRTGRFILGVQWHPDRGRKADPFAKALVTKVIDQARLRYNRYKWLGELFEYLLCAFVPLR